MPLTICDNMVPFMFPYLKRSRRRQRTNKHTNKHTNAVTDIYTNSSQMSQNPNRNYVVNFPFFQATSALALGSWPLKMVFVFVVVLFCFVVHFNFFDNGVCADSQQTLNRFSSDSQQIYQQILSRLSTDSQQILSKFSVIFCQNQAFSSRILCN